MPELIPSGRFPDLRDGNGRISLIGNFTPKIELPLQLGVTRELTLYGSCGSKGDYPACIDLLAKKYLGKDKYPFRQPGEVRVLYKIRPEKVSSMG